MTQQTICPSCHNWVSPQATQCQHCGTSLQGGMAGSPGQSYHDLMMQQAPPTQNGVDEEDIFAQDDRTVVSKGPRHAVEFSMPEEENYATIQMEGKKASELWGEASEVELANYLGDSDRTQMSGYPSQPAMPSPQGGMWSTPSQDAWNSPFANQQGGWGNMPPPPQVGWDPSVGGAENEQMTYSGPADIARAAGSESTGKRVGRMLKWLVLLLLVGGGLAAGYVYLLPMLNKPKKAKKQKVFVVLEVETQPKGADVWLNGHKLGEPTPATISTRIGRPVQIQIRKEGFKTVDFQWPANGYDKRKFFLQAKEQPKPRPRVDTPPDPPKVAVRPKPRKRVRKRRRRRRSFAGAGSGMVLSLRTVPSGAKVRINNRLWPGKTPLRISLPEGKKVRVTVQKYGHQDAFFVWSATKSETHVIKLYRHSWYNP